MYHTARSDNSIFPFARRAANVFLLGQIDFDRCMALQQRIIYDMCARADGQISLLICEHPQIITIGRGGSRSDVRLRSVQIAGRPVEIVRVNRGGGTMLHLPGQLAVYPLVPLDWHAWTVGEFLDRFQTGLNQALVDLGISGISRSGQHGVWGTSGQLVSLGVAVKHWVTYYGAQIHVTPPLPLFRYIDTDPIDHSPAGSLQLEHSSSIRMSRVRSRVVRAVCDALDCERYHLYSGHPLLSQIAKPYGGMARAM